MRASSGKSLRGLHPVFAERVRRFLELAYEPPTYRIIVTSAKRTAAKQAMLYNRSLRDGSVAAKPGHSLHERGLAVDLGQQANYFAGTQPVSDDWDKRANALGLRRLSGSLRSRDPWHWYPVEFGDNG